MNMKKLIDTLKGKIYLLTNPQTAIPSYSLMPILLDELEMT